ncbi:hypothetical protein LINGRAHAP2_LOCUS28360 [Linum grandiflorum]
MIKIVYIYRERNRPVDFLAGLSHKLPIGVHHIPITDPTLSHHLLVWGFSVSFDYE